LAVALTIRRPLHLRDALEKQVPLAYSDIGNYLNNACALAHGRRP